jgi:hypothetical protein
MTNSIMTFRKMTFSITTISKMTFSITTLGIMDLIATLNIRGTQHNDIKL